MGSSPHAFLAAMAGHVGLDPINGIRWIVSTDSSVKPMNLFAEGKIDAFLGFPPEPQELRSRQIGGVGRRTVQGCTGVCTTLRWREMDSNHRYLEDKLPLRDGLSSHT
jgi:hypothetical protein